MKRRKKWNKAEKPYFTACLTCNLYCVQTVDNGKTKYSVKNCPKLAKGSVYFPYAMEELLKGD